MPKQEITEKSRKYKGNTHEMVGQEVCDFRHNRESETVDRLGTSVTLERAKVRARIRVTSITFQL